MRTLKVIISGGGTGGHIFPAISIANAIKELVPQADILFVGAKGRMEMEKVPAAGYKIKGIPARGLKRPLYSLSNIGVAIDYLRCKIIAKKIIKEFKPNVVVGVGGYASAAIIGVAGKSNIPTLIQEQNSFAGLVNKENGKAVDKICVAYEGMERFFPKEKILLTGNPIRNDITLCTAEQKEEGYKFYNLNPNKKTIFVVGGSLGCRTLNNCMIAEIDKGDLFKPALNGEKEYQVIWQCGKYYKNEVDSFMRGRNEPNVYYTHFIGRMDLAYAVADIVVSRAGAGTISELCVAGKCTIFIPSPIVAEDHQTHNAMALVNKNAAIMIKDAVAQDELIPRIKELLNNPHKIEEYEKNIATLAKKDAAKVIAQECIKLVEKNR
ncbi:MAG: undecaprenyldiphospho-muramoylpentapeptide beta-N-acetylglucosaminyltransferase [Bacteroidales bacterium]